MCRVHAKMYCKRWAKVTSTRGCGATDSKPISSGVKGRDRPVMWGDMVLWCALSMFTRV